MCPLFEIVSTPTFTSICANVFIIIFLSDDDTDGVREEDNTPPDVEPFASNDNNAESNRRSLNLSLRSFKLE